MDDRLSKLERELRANPYDWNKRKELAEQYRRHRDYIAANLLLLAPECAEHLREQPAPADRQLEWEEPENEGWTRLRRADLANVPCEIWLQGDDTPKPNQVLNIIIPVDLPLKAAAERLQMLRGMQMLLQRYFMVEANEQVYDDSKQHSFGLSFRKDIIPEDPKTYLANCDKVIKYFRENLHLIDGVE